VGDITPMWASMGTSVAQLEDTYARWLKRTDERLVAAFDAFEAAVG
jgi:hypothetical protein